MNMKRTYEDLTNDEKKEYHVFKNITGDIPYTLGMITLFIFLIPFCFTESGKYLFRYHALGMVLVTIFLMIFYYRDLKKVKQLYGM